MKRLHKIFYVAPLALAIAGCEGEAGPQGDPGAPGAKGDKGDPGDPGMNGMDGMNGTNGMNGMNGMDATLFDFRADAPAAYTRVDRMGMPAVATALVSAAGKEAYNDADPNDDVTAGAGGLPMFVGPEIAPSLAGLHSALADDFTSLGLTACAQNDGGTFDVIPCATQTVGNGGPSVLSLVVPDTLTLDVNAPSGFPNGRRLEDPVIDVTLAVILLDLTTHAPDLLASLPLNPPSNDVQFSADFPYLAYPHAN
jgi:hypothetical protein